jgi:hypothetical protein
MVAARTAIPSPTSAPSTRIGRSRRKFDCRDDERIWLDFEKKIPAPPLAAPGDDPVAQAELLLHLPPQRMDRENA